MSDQERAAGRRRASFARRDRLAKEADQKADRDKAEAQRRTARDKADAQRRAESAKAAEQRVAQARKQAEQRRLQRHKENAKKEFSRKAEDRKALEVRADQQRAAEAAKTAEQARQTNNDQQRRAAEAYVEKQHQRQAAEQREEHRRQTRRLRAEHQAERSGFGHREAAAVIQHARQIRNIDIRERRALEEWAVRRDSLAGRLAGLVRGAKHFDRQAQAIVERHENDRWQAHRDHEAGKHRRFYTEQGARLCRVAARYVIAGRHQAERGELRQAQAQDRPRQIEARVQALAHASENHKPRQQERPQDVERPAEPFNQAAANRPEDRALSEGRGPGLCR